MISKSLLINWLIHLKLAKVEFKEHYGKTFLGLSLKLKREAPLTSKEVNNGKECGGRRFV